MKPSEPAETSPANATAVRVAIVGGGPAGLMAAVLFARRGIATTVIERGRWPIDKVCGEGIMPLGVALLRKHGLLDRIDPDRSRPFTGIRYVDRDGAEAEGSFRGEPGLVVRRLALSEALHEAAREEPLVTLLGGHTLVGFRERDDRVDVVVRDLGGDDSEVLPGFTYLVGADGLKSKVRRLAGMDGVAPGKQPRRMGARVHYRIRPWSERVEVWWQDHLEAYVAPTSDGCVEFVFSWDHDELFPDGRPAGEGLEKLLFDRFPELAALVAGAERQSPWKSWGPLPQRAVEPLAGRIALLGDAGLFYDPITGEGLTLAFLQAELAAETIASWDRSAGRDEFRARLKRVADHYVRITGFAMFFTRHAFLRGLMVRLLSACPGLFAHLLHANMGEVSMFAPDLRELARGLRLPRRRVRTPRTPAPAPAARPRRTAVVGSSVGE